MGFLESEGQYCSKNCECVSVASFNGLVNPQPELVGAGIAMFICREQVILTGTFRVRTVLTIVSDSVRAFVCLASLNLAATRAGRFLGRSRLSLVMLLEDAMVAVS